MMEFYPQVKSAHVHLVVLSGLLFALRGGALLLARAQWPRHAALRYTSYTIDTALLTSAAMLYTMLHRAGITASGLFANGWLTLKLALLALYVVLGFCALWSRLGRAGQLACYAAALGCYVFIYGIARMHHPLGWLLLLS